MDAERKQFLEQRRLGIGGSDAAALCGVDPYKGPMEVFVEKLGLAPDREVGIDLKRGIRSEGWAVEEFIEDTGFNVIRNPPPLIHLDASWMRVNLDGLVIEEPEKTPLDYFKTGRSVPVTALPLEVKCPRLHNYYAVKKDGATDSMICQLQHGMAVVGPHVERAWFVVFHGDAGHVKFSMDRDDELIGKIMEAEERFWTEYVLKQIPPPQAFGLEVADNLNLPEGLGAEIVQIDSDRWQDMTRRLREAKQLVTEAKALYGEKMDGGEYSGILGEIAGFMDKLGITAAEGGGAKVYYKEHQGRRFFDEKRLRAAAPLDAALVQEALSALGSEAASWPSVYEVLKKCRLDFERFQRRRSSYRSIRPYFKDD